MCSICETLHTSAIEFVIFWSTRVMSDIWMSHVTHEYMWMNISPIRNNYHSAPLSHALIELVICACLSKEPYILSKEPYILSKEPYIQPEMSVYKTIAASRCHTLARSQQVIFMCGMSHSRVRHVLFTRVEWRVGVCAVCVCKLN